jgi:hypothetical protein
VPTDFTLWYRAVDGGLWLQLHHGAVEACEYDEAERKRRGWRGKFRILPTSGPAPRRRFVPPAHSAGIGRNPADWPTV